jgi:hypothetical protein
MVAALGWRGTTMTTRRLLPILIQPIVHRLLSVTETAAGSERSKAGDKPELEEHRSVKASDVAAVPLARACGFTLSNPAQTMFALANLYPTPASVASRRSEVFAVIRIGENRPVIDPSTSGQRSTAPASSLAEKCAQPSQIAAPLRPVQSFFWGTAKFASNLVPKER